MNSSPLRSVEVIPHCQNRKCKYTPASTPIGNLSETDDQHRTQNATLDTGQETQGNTRLAHPLSTLRVQVNYANPSAILTYSTPTSSVPESPQANC